jgi:hypothetical protein
MAAVATAITTANPRPSHAGGPGQSLFEPSKLFLDFSDTPT